MKTSWFLLDVGEVDQYHHFDALPIGCLILENGLITSANVSFEEESGYSKGQLIGQEVINYLIPSALDSENAHFSTLKELLNGKQGSKKNLRMQLKCANKKEEQVVISIRTQKEQVGTKQRSSCLLTITSIEGISKAASHADQKNAFSTLETVIENSPHGIVAFDKELRIQFFNDYANHIYKDNSSKDLQVGKSLSEYFDKELLAQRSNDVFEEVFSGKSITKDFVLKNGQLFIRVKFKPILDSNDQIIGLLETIEDRTQEVLQSQEILNRQMLLGSMLKMADSYFMYFNLDFEVLYFNSEADSIHQLILDIDLKKGMHLKEVYGLEGFESRKKEYYDTVLSKGELTRRIEYKDKNDKPRFIDVTYKIMRDVADKIVGILEFGKDVTELIVSDFHRKSTELTLELVMDNSKDSYVAYDIDLNVKFFNKVAEKRYKQIIDHTLEVGKNIEELSGKIEGLDKRLATYREVMETGEPTLREASYKVEGKHYYFQNRVSCLRDQAGKVVGILSCSSDISELIKSQNDLASRNSTLTAVLDSALDGITAFDKDFNVLACNEQAVKEFQKFVNVDLLSGVNIKEQISSEELTRWRETIYDKIFSGQTIENVVKRDLTKQTFKNIYTPVKNSEGHIIGALELSRNITEIENKSLEIKKSEQRLRGLVDHIPTGLAKVDQNGKISYTSPRGAAILGYTQEELLGKYLLDLMVETDKASLLKDMQELLSGEIKEKFSTHSYVQKNGSIRKIEGIASITKAIDNELAFLLAFNDTTEKHETQLKLNETANNFVSLFMNMHDAVIIYNHKDEKYVNCNEAGLKLFNRSKADLLKGSRLDFVPEYSSLIPEVNLHERMKSNREITSKGEKIEDSTTVLIDGGGTERLVAVNIVPKSDNEVYLIMKDVTDAYMKDFLLKEKTSVYETLIHNSFDGIDIVKYKSSDGYFRDGELIMRNERMSRFIGGETNELFDSDESLLTISPELQPNGIKSSTIAKDIIVKTLKEGESLIDYRFEHSNSYFDVEASQKMVEIDDYVYLIKNYRDITDAVKQRDIIEEQIQALNAKNEEMKIYIESNLQLENFAYIASHDLKAPIRSVISFAQLLKNNAYDLLGPKNGRFLDIIITASTNMQVLIDDLLAYSRINTQEIEFEKVDMDKLLKHLLIEINQSIAEKNGEVIIKNLPATLVGDASRLRQIFQNLVTNGMKFHQEGETPKVEIDSLEKRDHYLFTVKDFGIGIEEQYLREIFLMFKKLHSENKYKGTGIGLSICKKIVEQHEGDIWVESTLGEGSTFYFTVSKNLKVNI